MANDEEEWRPAKGYEGYYEVSNMGNVKGVDRHVGHNYGGKKAYKGTVRKLTRHTAGYFLVMLYKDTIHKEYYVHRLVAEAFLSDYNPRLQVNHKNGVKNDNRVDNLECVTCSQNLKHAYKTGLHSPRGKDKIKRKRRVA